MTRGRELVAKSDLPELQSFANGVEKDKDAVKAGLTWPVNNGEARGTSDEIEARFRAPCMEKLVFLFYESLVLHAV